MARGLSELQQFILKRAARFPRVPLVDVLEIYFQWEPDIPIERHDKKSNLAGQIVDTSQRYFSQEKIGRENYNRTMASLSRAVSRLVARGLVERGRCLSWGRRTAAVRLTDAGRKWVKAHKAVK